MKRFAFLIIIGISMLFLAMSCKKDNIVTIDASTVVDNSDDYIDSIDFARTVYVTYSTSGTATVSGTSDDFTVTVNGNCVSIVNGGDETVKYELSGTATSGYLRLYGTSTQAIYLNNVSLSYSDNAIYVSGGGRTFIVASGSNSTTEIFGAGQLVFCGDGSLNITAANTNGIESESYVRIMGSPTITVTASATTMKGIKTDGNFIIDGGNLTITNSATGGKGIKGDGNGYFNGGTVTVTTTGSNYTADDVSAKAIKFDGNLTFAGSTVVVNCTAHEGIEAKGTITVSSGEVYSYSASDDAINSGSTFTINGGYVYAYAPQNDGLDANGDFYINGGVVYAIGSSSPEVAIDANTEEGYKLYFNGGTLIAIGGLESGSSLSQSCYSASSWSKNTWYAMTVGSTTYAFKTPSSGGTTLVVSGSSTPTLKSGVSVSGGTSYFEGNFATNATVSGGSSVTLSSYTGGNGGGPGGGGPGGGGH